MSSEERIAELIEDLAELDEDVINEAKTELIEIGDVAVTQLIETLAHNLYDVVEHAADVLVAIGEPVIPALMDEI